MATTTSARSRRRCSRRLLAERRGDAEAAADAYRRALERSERAGFTEHASFALSGLGSIAFADGNLGEAEARYRRAVAVAEAASASWLVAHAKARLAQVLAAVGDAEAAETLYRGVDRLVRSSRASTRPARRSSSRLSAARGRAALLGLAELADARGDAAAARRVARPRRARARLSRTVGWQRADAAAPRLAASARAARRGSRGRTCGSRLAVRYATVG